MFALTLSMIYRTYHSDADLTVLDVAAFLNTETPHDARIETYDSELFFLLNRPYHYPPDEVHVQLNRRTFLGENVNLNYDVLSFDPDYLVIGPHARMWRLYEDVINDGHFRLIRDFGRYTVYRSAKS
jgi:hypothetical protein